MKGILGFRAFRFGNLFKRWGHVVLPAYSVRYHRVQACHVFYLLDREV